MNFGYIIFWDAEEKPVRITPEEHKKIYNGWEKNDFFKLASGRIINKKSIKDVKPPQKPEPLKLEAPQGKTITKEKLDELKKRFASKFK